MNGLTPRQAEVMSVIFDTINRRGYPPSESEIGEALDIVPTSAGNLIRRMLKKKALYRESVRYGTLRPTLYGEALYNEFVLLKGDALDFRIQSCPSYGHATPRDPNSGSADHDPAVDGGAGRKR